LELNMTAVPQLPSSWLSQFDGEDLQVKTEVSAILATADEAGRPHVSYLSAGEVFVRGNLQLALMLWPGAHSVANIERSGLAVLHAAAEGAVWEAQLVLRRRSAGNEDELAIFDGIIETVRRNAAPYAEVQGLVAFSLYSPADTLARWRLQVARMRGPTGDTMEVAR
jgi:hypothetical protein